MSSNPDFALYMNAVARDLLGEPNARLSTASELRFGNNGSMKVNLPDGTFFDFETDEGGGVLDLIKRERGLTGKAAIEFMRQIGCDVGDAPRKGNGSTNGAGAGTGTRKQVAVFEYHDETGDTVFEVVRFHYRDQDDRLVVEDISGKPRKTFRQRRRDPAGGYIWNVKGVRVIPYRLDLLIANLRATPDDPVLIVEGEMKVDVLVDWDLIATCNAGGAKKWTSEHADFLRGAHVIILADNDPAGREHSNVVGASLKGVARSVRMLDLPNSPPKGDALDWIRAGGTRAQFLKLLEQAEEWEPIKQEQIASTRPAADPSTACCWMTSMPTCRGTGSSTRRPARCGPPAASTPASHRCRSMTPGRRPSAPAHGSTRTRPCSR